MKSTSTLQFCEIETERNPVWIYVYYVVFLGKEEIFHIAESQGLRSHWDNAVPVNMHTADGLKLTVGEWIRDVEVTVMHRSGPHWNWPIQEDEILLFFCACYPKRF